MNYEKMSKVQLISEIKRLKERETEMERSTSESLDLELTKKGRVLVVDDNPTNLMIMEEIFADPNEFVVQAVENGEDALECLEEFKPDIILLDIMMPGISGFEVTRTIRDKREFDLIKIILVSGKTSIDDKLKGYGGGADDYVTKPFDEDELLAKVKVFLRLSKVEKVLASSQKVLEERINSRTKELNSMKVKAEDASSVRGLFIANMGSEISRPMDRVLTMTELLLGTELDGRQKEFTENISDNGHDLMVLVNNIMDFLKLEAGRLKIEKEPFSLGQCVEKLFGLMKIIANEKNVILTYSLDSKTPPTIVGDYNRVKQVLTYLVENAIDSTDAGEVSVRISTTSENGSCNVKFEVTDSGVGIPEDEIKDLFKADFDIEDAIRKRRVEKNRLSLILCKQIAVLMGGDVTVKSKMGKGTTFTLLMKGKIPDSLLLEKQERLELDPEYGRKHPLRILVVDDNRINQMMATRMLEKIGFRSDVASNGREAIEAVKNNKYDVVFMDMMMPVMGGLDAAKRICQKYRPEYRPIIIAMTAQVHDEDKAACFAVGMEGFVGKPLSVESFLEALQGIQRKEY
jgi:CheY-like chemotaxis protein